MTEETYPQILWDEALRCGTVFFDKRIMSLFVDGLLPGPRTGTHQSLF